MEIVKGFPPNYDRIIEAFPAAKGRYVAFTYGDTVYLPKGGPLSVDVQAHESVHVGQQGRHPELWWSRYCDDRMFRLDQEVEAYRAQYRFALAYYDRSTRRKLLAAIVNHLSGPLYGRLVSRQEARALIVAEP